MNDARVLCPISSVRISFCARMLPRRNMEKLNQVLSLLPKSITIFNPHSCLLSHTSTRHHTLLRAPRDRSMARRAFLDIRSSGRLKRVPCPFHAMLKRVFDLYGRLNGRRSARARERYQGRPRERRQTLFEQKYTFT